MGNLLGGAKVDPGEGEEGTVGTGNKDGNSSAHDDEKDPRRRNSFAFYITKTVTKKDNEDWVKILNDIKIEKAPKIAIDPKLQNSKLTKLAESILQGNMRELRNQVIVNWKTINRSYKDLFGNASLLHFACQEGYPEMLKFMLDDASHSEFDNDTILDLNARDNKNRTPLHYVFTPPAMTFCGQKFGLMDDGTPNSERPDGIEVASDYILPGMRKRREECIELLIKKGCSVNEKDFHSFYPIHYATIYGWDKAVVSLVNEGADVNVLNVVGKSALHFAVEYKRHVIVEFLAAHPKTVIDTCDVDGVTALHMAVEMSDKRMTECLLKNNADTNVVTHNKKTPLKDSCRNQDVPLIMLLFDYKVQRRPSALDLLEGEAKFAINRRIEAEEKAAALELERQLAEMKQRELDGQAVDFSATAGFRSKNPFGNWVEYVDKRSGKTFFYNPVSRVSQFDKPKDFKLNKDWVIKDATFGMSFYH